MKAKARNLKKKTATEKNTDDNNNSVLKTNVASHANSQQKNHQKQQTETLA